VSLASRIGAAFGMGATRVEVHINEAANWRGSTITGAVVVRGGAVEQTLMKVTLDLMEFWSEGGGAHRTTEQRRAERITLCETMQAGPGSQQALPFEIGVPSCARCTRRREGWRLDAEAHIALAVDARASLALNVLPHPEVLALQRAMRDGLGFGPVRWRGELAEIQYDFTPPPALLDQIEGLTLCALVEGIDVVGRLAVNREEHGVADVLRSMVGADRQSVPFRIPRSALLTKRGTPNPAGAAPPLRAALAGAGLRPPEARTA